MGSHFIPDRCVIVDMIGSNTLIRGNMPLIAPDDHYALSEISAASGVNMAGKRFIEIPIIDNVGERDQFAAIIQAFGVDPENYPTSFWPWWQQPGYNPDTQRGTILTTEGHSISGSFIWRPFEGLPANTDSDLFLYAPGWDFDGFITMVVDLLHTCEDTVIYVHCQLGADRTGAFHIGYLMNAHGLDLETAIKEASDATPAGAPNADYIRLVTAYADSFKSISR